MTGDLFFDDPPLPGCSMARQVTVAVGSLATAAVLGVLVASVAWRTLIERRLP